jgi:hypothetical protein
MNPVSTTFANATRALLHECAWAPVAMLRGPGGGIRSAVDPTLQ